MGRNDFTYRSGYNGSLATRMRRYTRTGDGCWEWIGSRTLDNYGHIRVKGRLRPAHRVAYELVHGPLPAGAVMMHLCDNPPCVRPEHLRVGTSKENSDDKRTKGRSRAAAGEAHPAARLTEAAVREARRLHGEHHTFTEIASRFGVSRSAIARAVTGRNWR